MGIGELFKDTVAGFARLASRQVCAGSHWLNILSVLRLQPHRRGIVRLKNSRTIACGPRLPRPVATARGFSTLCIPAVNSRCS